MFKSKRLYGINDDCQPEADGSRFEELADEFGVSTRTIQRDLQELSELGVPLSRK